MSNTDFTGVPLDDLAASIAEENFLMLRYANLDYSHVEVSAQIVKHLIKCMIVDSILEKVNEVKTNKEKYEASRKALQRVKTQVQEAVSEGFSLAFRGYAGQEVEYYCLVKDVPEPVSKALN